MDEAEQICGQGSEVGLFGAFAIGLVEGRVARLRLLF